MNFIRSYYSVFIGIFLCISCGSENNKVNDIKDLAPNINKADDFKPLAPKNNKVNDIRSLASDINKIDLEAISIMMCKDIEDSANCLARRRSYFNTPEKRKKLDQSVVENLLYAAEQGFSFAKIKKTVQEAAATSKKLGAITSIVQLSDLSSKEVTLLLICMTANSNTDRSGVLYDKACLGNSLNKQNLL
jgi:hypothetical protein